MTAPTLQRISEHREHISELLVAGQLDGIDAAQDAFLSTLGTGPDSMRARREIDDLPRRILFRWLSALRQMDAGGSAPMNEAGIFARCEAIIGDQDTWLRQFQDASSNDRARLVVVLTWQCETRCTYCNIPKQSGREMPLETLDAAIELLFSSDKPSLELRFFGGEPMMEWERIQHGILKARELCGNRDVRFMITTNGYALTRDRIRWLADHPVHLQLALDGLPETHNKHRRSIIPGETSYENSAIDKADLLHELGMEYDVIQVVHPGRVTGFVEDFQHIADNGFRKIQLNWAHNMMWRTKDLEAFATGLHRLGDDLRQRWDEGQPCWLTNLGETLQRVRNNREVTVDWDGGIYANNAVLYRPEHLDNLKLGDLEDGKNWLPYRVDGPSGDALLDLSFAKPVHENNAKVGAILSSWIRWMRKQGLPYPH